MAQFPWPNGARCAVALTFDEDGECVPLLYDPQNARKRLTLQSEGTYGPNVGSPRILDLLDKHGLKGSFFTPGFVAERHPELMREIIARGHELGHHGYLHERPDFVDEVEEERIMVRGLEVLESITGVRPRGYRSPAWELKPTSPALIKRYGFLYDSSLMGDDEPYLVDAETPPSGGDSSPWQGETPLPTGRGLGEGYREGAGLGGVTDEEKLLEIPIQWMNDDWAYFGFSSIPALGNGIASPRAVFEVWSEEFAGYYDVGGCYVLTMHPFVIGRPSRIRLLNRLIEFMKEFDGVWFATLERIANHALSTGRVRYRPHADLGDG